MNKDRDINKDTRTVLSKRISDGRILQHMIRALSITLDAPRESAEQRPGQPQARPEQPGQPQGIALDLAPGKLALYEAPVRADPYSDCPGLFFFARERRGRTHRIVIYHAGDLSLGHDLPFVGFISGRRRTALPAIGSEIEQLDRQLVAELANAPAVLSYSSLQLHSGNWYNLAIFRDAGGKTIFHRMDTHTYAAHEIAPRYYDWIRLHHGIIVGTLADGVLHLQYTRHITFDEQYAPTMRLIIHQLEEGKEGEEHAR